MLVACMYMLVACMHMLVACMHMQVAAVTTRGTTLENSMAENSDMWRIDPKHAQTEHATGFQSDKLGYARVRTEINDGIQATCAHRNMHRHKTAAPITW